MRILRLASRPLVWTRDFIDDLLSLIEYCDNCEGLFNDLNDDFLKFENTML